MPRRPPPRAARLAWGALVAVARVLPWGARLRFAGLAGRIATTRVPRLRARIEANLAYVLPDADAAERARIVRETGDTFGRTFVEILCNPEFHARRSWTGPTGPGVAAIEEAAKAAAAPCSSPGISGSGRPGAPG